MPWADVSGFGTMGCVAWHETRASAIRAQSPFDYLETSPAEGARYWLSLSCPFYAEVGKQFWCIWEPLLVTSNGWDEGTITQVGEIRTVECTLLCAKKTDQRSAYAEVRVDRVISLDQLAALHPIKPDLTLMFSELSLGRCQTYSHGDYMVVDHCLEGDIGAWAIFKGKNVLIFSRWGFHEDHFWAGCALVDKTRLGQLRRLLAHRLSDPDEAE